MARALPPDALYLFREGTMNRAYDHLGAGTARGGTRFRVWAPHAALASVVGDFNGWDPAGGVMERCEGGIWSSEMTPAGPGDRYGFAVTGSDGVVRLKADPYARAAEVPPGTSSVVHVSSHEWGDQAWMSDRGHRHTHQAPLAIYELHAGSWRRLGWGESPGYRDLAEPLAEYVVDSGFTHVEFLPLTEHPYYPSWGYQTTSYFAPTGRYGGPDDLKYLVDRLHQADIGVILDWVPSHFATDEHGLGWFDGQALYEHPDWRRGWHPDWDSAVFDYGRPEVRSFLLSSANYWLDEYHVDGIRVDAVASMLYLDYSREEGQWLPNRFGGNENIEAVEFLQTLNSSVYSTHPGVFTVAEESTAWPGVTRPAADGGLGFGFKWDMGWMHDTLAYFGHDPVHRPYHHDKLTFRMLYAYNENFILPLSHDEVVHGKGSLLGKMSGDRWQRFANLRALFGYMYASVGKKLLFMGAEVGQASEWDHDAGVDWPSEGDDLENGMARWVTALNAMYQNQPALHVADTDPDGFEWLAIGDVAASVVALERRTAGHPPVVAVCHFTPAPRDGYRIGVKYPGPWKVLLNSDAEVFGGAGRSLATEVTTEAVPAHGHQQSIVLDLPPLGVVFLTPREA